MRIFFPFLLMMLFLAGCAISSNSVDMNDCPFDMYLTNKNEKVTLEKGHYECRFGNYVEMTDVLGPTQIAEQIDPIKVQGETEVQFETDGSPELKVLLLESEDKSERVSLKNENTLVLPKESNEYIYQIKATWGKSLVTYVLLVDIVNEKE